MLSDELVAKGAEASLVKHPLIRSVTPQRKVTRTLTSVTTSEEDDLEADEAAEEEEMEKWRKEGKDVLVVEGELGCYYKFLNGSWH